MSDIKEDGFASSEILSNLATAFEKMSDSDRKAQIKKTNGVFQIDVKNDNGKTATWTIDLKEQGKVSKGAPSKKADVIMTLADKHFVELSEGKLNGQKAFMTGLLKVKGNVMMATKLDAVLKTAKAKL
ncbi:SCP2 sterol-binding domain-containing protein [Kockovaella imperatae]|uniref:SCP2 sterol-binding domain-containing protein n=1 Tax=Kockovaella imperatae TaxID=4999 RepID=A0A1Y1UQJ5_9TREE|nr:SCP2 sterol-binding domain-containing protein [Kockovaella imperatae]ORX39415.1 SCP2 sterol-binding domain-containing protein [Kockovaella imperatae]